MDFETVPQALSNKERIQFVNDARYVAEQMRWVSGRALSLDTINALYLGLPE